MTCRTVVVLSCLGLAAAMSPGDCTDSSPESTTCCDVDQTTNKKCVEHVRWAIDQGERNHPHWYSIYKVKHGSSFADFQCALYLIAYNKAEQAIEAGFPAKDHGCPIPCTATVENECAKPPTPNPPVVRAKKVEVPATCPVGFEPPGAVALAACTCGVNATTAEGICAEASVDTCAPLVCQTCNIECPGSSVSPWMIALILILVSALAAGLAYLLCMPKEKSKKKKKRAAPKEKSIFVAPAPVEPAPVPQTRSFTMVPMPQPQPQPVQMVTMVAQPQPQPVQMVQMVAQPQPQPMQSMTMVAQPPPVQMVQPVQTMVQTYAAPVPQPVQTTAVPMVQYAATAVQQPVSLFNALDRNGDGVITRAEMSQMGQFQQPQYR